MNLIEKLAVALLCSTISLPLCYGMDSSQKDEKHKIESRSTLPSKEAERLYQEAFINLEQQIYNNKPKDSSPFVQLSRAAHLGHPLAPVLVTLVITSMKVEHVGWNPDTEKNLVKLHYFFGHYEEGFMSLLPLLKQDDNEIKTLVKEILKDEKVIADFFTRLQFVTADNTLSYEEALGIKRRALHYSFMNDHSSFKKFDLGESTFALIASLYISNSDNDELLLSQGLKFGIIAAGRGNQQAYEMLLKTLQEKNAYEIYYRQLFGFLLGEEEWAENLFNKVAFADEHAYAYVYQYALNEKEKGNNDTLKKLNRIMKKHNELKEAKQTSASHTPLSQPLQSIDSIAGETPTKRRRESEKPKTPQEQFNIALNLQDSNPLEAIKIYTAIVESDVPISNTLNKRINTQLEIIGKKFGYNKNQFKELLESQKGFQKTTSPTQRSKKSSLISSSKEKPSPVTIKSKQGNTTTPPISLAVKEEKATKKKSPDSLGDVSQAEASETVDVKTPTENKGTKRRITNDKEEGSLISESAQSESEASSKSEASTSSHRKLTNLSKRKPRKRDERGSGTTLNDLTENQRSKHNLIGNTSNLPNEVTDSLELKTPTKVSKTLKLTEESSHKKEKEKKKKREKSANQINIKDYIKSDAKKKRHKIERQLAPRDEEINSFSTRSTNSTSSLSDAESSSHSETSTSSYKELTKLSKRRSSNLDEKTIRKTLEKLQRNGKANCDLEGGKIGGTPTNIRDERLTIHTTHGKHGRKWHERPEVVNQFYDFVVSCDDSLSETIEEIKNNK